MGDPCSLHFTFISNFGIGGAIGNAVSSFFFGVFGLIAYIFPVVLVIGTFLQHPIKAIGSQR